MNHTYALVVRTTDMAFAHVERTDNSITNYVKGARMKKEILLQQLIELRDQAIKDVVSGEEKSETINSILDMYLEAVKVLDAKK